MLDKSDGTGMEAAMSCQPRVARHGGWGWQVSDNTWMLVDVVPTVRPSAHGGEIWHRS